MTTELDTQLAADAADDADFAAGFAQLADKPPEDDPATTEPAAAPSTEGVVTSEADEPTPDENKPAPRVNLGGLSTDEILALVPEGDARRAVELRLRRMEKQAPRSNKALADIETAGANVRASIKQLENDYPDIAAGLAPMTDFVDKVAVPLRQAEQQAALSQAQATVEKTFPGFMQVVGNEEFPKWLQTQSSDVQRDFSGGGTEGAFNVLSAYESHVTNLGRPTPFAPSPLPAPAAPAADLQSKAAQILEKRNRLLANNAAVPSGGRGAASLNTASRDDFDAGFELAKRTGTK